MTDSAQAAPCWRRSCSIVVRPRSCPRSDPSQPVMARSAGISMPAWAAASRTPPACSSLIVRITSGRSPALSSLSAARSIAWIGLAVSAGGTAVLYPTLLGMLTRSTREEARGRATSLLATVSYLGFLLGPVYVGLGSEAAGLRGAMLAVAGLCAALLVLTPVLLPICQHLSPEARKRVQSDIPMLDQ